MRRTQVQKRGKNSFLNYSQYCFLPSIFQTFWWLLWGQFQILFPVILHIDLCVCVCVEQRIGKKFLLVGWLVYAKEWCWNFQSMCSKKCVIIYSLLFSIKSFFRRETKQHFVKREFFETSKKFDLRETLNVILIFNIYYFCTANKKVAQTFFFLNFGMIFTWIKNNLSSAKTWLFSYFIFFLIFDLHFVIFKIRKMWRSYSYIFLSFEF